YLNPSHVHVDILAPSGTAALEAVSAWTSMASLAYGSVLISGHNIACTGRTFQKNFAEAWHGMKCGSGVGAWDIVSVQPPHIHAPGIQHEPQNFLLPLNAMMP